MQSKKWCPSHKFFYELFSVTQSLFLLGFSRGPDHITASNKKKTPKNELSSVSEMTIQYLPKKYYNSTTLSLWVVYRTYVSDDDDDDELFSWYDWLMKGIKPCFQPGPPSEILTIANLQDTASRIWACTEPEFRLCWMKLYSSDNHYTTTPCLKIWLYQVVIFYLLWYNVMQQPCMQKVTVY